MTTINEIEKLPQNLKQEILNFAEYLMQKHSEKNPKNQQSKKEVFERKIDKIKISGMSMSDTIRQLRDEEKW